MTSRAGGCGTVKRKCSSVAQKLALMKNMECEKSVAHVCVEYGVKN